MNEFVLQNLYPLQAKGIPFWMRGETTSGAVVYGIHVKTHCGVGFVISYKKEEFLIVNNFAFSVSCPPRLPVASFEDIEKEDMATLTPQTVAFWLSSGANTKRQLTREEMESGQLHDSFSNEGLKRSTIGLPILSYLLFPQVHMTESDIEQPNNTNHFLQTGKLLHHAVGDMPTKPICSYIEATLKENNNEWHLVRANMARTEGRRDLVIVGHCGKYLAYYEFDEEMHVLRVQEFSPSGSMAWNIKLPSHPPSCPCSPLGALVLDDITGIDLCNITTYSDKIARMTGDELYAEHEDVQKELIEISQMLADILQEERKRGF
jgi:hypothetical protein